MNVETNLTNHFLIAMPQLADPNFFRTVTYICGHNDEGAMGIVINRPLLDIDLGEIFNHLDIEAVNAEIGRQNVFIGGPLEPQHGFVLHSPNKNWKSTLFISDKVALTTSSDILSDIAHAQGPERSLVALGYAGWGAGQLEQELADNAWLNAPANADIIFDLAVEQRWPAAAALLGIDLNNLSDDIGHA